MSENVVYAINGPVVKSKGASDLSMMEMVYVGEKQLIGEVISISKEETIIQVYESTTGLKPNEKIVGTGSPVSVTLGPGILTNIFDGIERPLQKMEEESGSFICSGNSVSALDQDKKWDVHICVKVNDVLKGGDIIATCPETDLILHKCMLSPDLEGKIIEVKEDGLYRVEDEIAKLQDKQGNIHSLTLCQKWPIKKPRPTCARKQIEIPLITGQRVVDTLFPIAKGGTAAIPGGFGTGKTMMQHQLAKWCDADIIVYVGCGERGNEMTQVLEEFSALIDPKSGKSLMERTVLIANTSNMPVAAREASIYTGVSIAEYYRDMGYHVAMMADSTSRWAEALREISGRLEEMPAEEGFPAYLPSRISQFYERAGYMKNLNGSEGSVSIIGAVSPQGSDFSEPVTQNTKRFVRCFWALDKSLAYARHYAAVNWNESYSEYVNDLEGYYNHHLGMNFLQYRKEIMSILTEETKLLEIVKLMGADVLPQNQKLIIEVAKLIRVGFLQQNAFHKEDTYVSMEKQMKMMEIILYLYHICKEAMNSGKSIYAILSLGLFEKVVKMKYDIPNDKLEMFDAYKKEIAIAIHNMK